MDLADPATDPSVMKFTSINNIRSKVLGNLPASFGDQDTQGEAEHSAKRERASERKVFCGNRANRPGKGYDYLQHLPRGGRASTGMSELLSGDISTPNQNIATLDGVAHHPGIPSYILRRSG